MTIFTGAQARSIEQTAVQLIADQLVAGFADEDFSAAFERYDGVKVVTEELLTAQAAKTVLAKPMVFVTMEARKSKPWKTELDGVVRVGEEHAITVTAEVITSDRCYLAEPAVRDAIAGIISKYKKALRLAGFHEARCDPDQRHTMDLTKVNPIAILGDVFTLKG